MGIKKTYNTLISYKYLVILFVIIAGLMISSALIEMKQSKKEMLQLMDKQTHVLLGTLITSSQNVLIANELLENSLTERLLNNANYVKHLMDEGKISNSTLLRICQNNNLFRIYVINRNGTPLYTSHPGSYKKSKISQTVQLLKPIFTGKKKSMVLGIKKAMYEDQYHFAVAVATSSRLAVVININAQELLHFRKTVGFGTLLRKVATNSNIVFTALQDTTTIISASGNVSELEKITASPFLYSALKDSLYKSRIYNFNGEEVFEAVQPFYYYDMPVGLYRIGLSLEVFKQINSRIYKRLVIISVILTFIGFILFILTIFRQNLFLMKKQYKSIETYSSKVINHVGDGIAVIDENLQIIKYNNAFKDLFLTGDKNKHSISLESVIPQEDLQNILQSPSSINTLNLHVNNKPKELLISQSGFKDENNKQNTILVFKDITKIKQLEQQIARKERLSAMGALASGVAHEIRNPLNTISTIIQQLDMDFEPKDNAQEYHQLARLVFGEVKRINNTILDFLRFAKPEPLNISTFPVNDLLQEIENQYSSMCAQKSIAFSSDIQCKVNVSWDYNKIKQALMNIMQNAIDVMDGGKIEISCSSEEQNNIVSIIIKDNGPGIPKHLLPKIFNLYFTTKAEGTGIGLSIVQKIINEHEGKIEVRSEENKGTEFIITIPPLIVTAE